MERREGGNRETYPSSSPPKPERNLMRKQLSETEHQAVDERQQEIDRCRAEYGEDCGRGVEDHVLACVAEGVGSVVAGR